MEASKIESKHSSTIGTVCRDNTGRVRYNNGKLIGDCLITMTKKLAKYEEVPATNQKQLFYIIVESNSQVVI